jgi:signal transduction histidine kinase
MSWVTVIFSMIASAALTLAAIYTLVWHRNRSSSVPLLFSLTAASTVTYAFVELWIMRTQTPGELDAALRWGQVPLSLWLLSLMWFVWMYLGAGRPWLAWTIVGLRVIFVLPSFLLGGNANLGEIPSVQRVPLLGELVTVVAGVPKPWALLGSGTSLLILIFVADASLTAWRRGDRRKALMVGGSVEFFLLGALVASVLMIWAGVRMPLAFSTCYLAVVGTMGYELSRDDVIRASPLVPGLPRSPRRTSDGFARLMAAQESERTRIARDLHDDVSQRIAGLSLMMSGVRARLLARPEDADLIVAVASMQRQITALSGQIRQVSDDLHPSLLDDAGLVKALGVLCADFAERQAIAASFSAAADIGPIGDDTAVCLYRVAQEALRNVAEHAAARHVDMALNRTAAGVTLSISDDGTGFDLTTAAGKGSGLGLVNIDERVRLLGGRVRIETRRGGGTSLQVEVPPS